MFTIDNAGTTWQRIGRCYSFSELQQLGFTAESECLNIKIQNDSDRFQNSFSRKINTTIIFKNICHRRDWYFRQPPSLHSTKLSTFRRQNRSPTLLEMRKGMGLLETPNPKVPPEEVLLLPFPPVMSHLNPFPISAPCTSTVNSGIILCSTLNSSHNILLHMLRTTF
jgi:hypothetical protein